MRGLKSNKRRIQALLVLLMILAQTVMQMVIPLSEVRAYKNYTGANDATDASGPDYDTAEEWYNSIIDECDLFKGSITLINSSGQTIKDAGRVNETTYYEDSMETKYVIRMDISESNASTGVAARFFQYKLSGIGVTEFGVTPNFSGSNCYVDISFEIKELLEEYTIVIPKGFYMNTTNKATEAVTVTIKNESNEEGVTLEILEASYKSSTRELTYGFITNATSYDCFITYSIPNDDNKIVKGGKTGIDKNERNKTVTVSKTVTVPDDDNYKNISYLYVDAYKDSTENKITKSFPIGFRAAQKQRL